MQASKCSLVRAGCWRQWTRINALLENEINLCIVYFNNLNNFRFAHLTLLKLFDYTIILNDDLIQDPVVGFHASSVQTDKPWLQRHDWGRRTCPRALDEVLQTRA